MARGHMPEKFVAEIGGRIGTVDLQVVEFQPYDPGAYQLDAGWSCFYAYLHDGAQAIDEYFVSMHTGEVYIWTWYRKGIRPRRPFNVRVGVVRELVEAAEKVEATMRGDFIRYDGEGNEVEQIPLF